MRSPGRLGLPATGIEIFDLNSSGVIESATSTIAASWLGKPPGPSGLACAGTISLSLSGSRRAPPRAAPTSTHYGIEGELVRCDAGGARAGEGSPRYPARVAPATGERVSLQPAASLPERPTLRTAEVAAALTAIYSWNYEPEIDQLRTLYANALDRQWIALRELDWEAGIDREALTRTFTMGGLPVAETKFWQELPFETRWQVSRTSAAFMLSNFLHGEQGALMVAGQLVNAVPHMDGKLYAATQTLDEARHVEVFAAYIQKLGQVFPITRGLQELLDAIVAAPDWKFKAVGMQVVTEGLALYFFRDMRNQTQEPLLKRLLTYVSRDEARHTGYGIKYLGHVVPTLSPQENRELQDFAFECTRKSDGVARGEHDARSRDEDVERCRGRSQRRADGARRRAGRDRTRAGAHRRALRPGVGLHHPDAAGARPLRRAHRGTVQADVDGDAGARGRRALRELDGQRCPTTSKPG